MYLGMATWRVRTGLSIIALALAPVPQTLLDVKIEHTTPSPMGTSFPAPPNPTGENYFYFIFLKCMFFYGNKNIILIIKDLINMFLKINNIFKWLDTCLTENENKIIKVSLKKKIIKVNKVNSNKRVRAGMGVGGINIPRPPSCTSPRPVLKPYRWYLIKTLINWNTTYNMPYNKIYTKDLTEKLYTVSHWVFSKAKKNTKALLTVGLLQNIKRNINLYVYPLSIDGCMYMHVWACACTKYFRFFFFF